MTYLVTGGSGFIGSHLVQKLLENGHSVINVDNFDDFYDYRIKVNNTLESIGAHKKEEFLEKNLEIRKLAAETCAENYRLYCADITNADALRDVFQNHHLDAVIHLAALAGVRPSIERPADYENVNVRGSINIWELCKEFNVKKLLCASSSSVYGNSDQIPFSETTTVDEPISPYAATKRCCEILGHVYHHLYQLDMVHLRFFTVYGPRQRPDLAIHKFADHIYNGTSIPFYGNGFTSRDYTYIDDIIHGILRALDYVQANSPVYEIINLGENEVVSLDEMVNTLENELQITAERNCLPMQPGDVLKTNADISKARRLLSYSPATDFQNGIKKFVEWFLENRRR